MSGPDLASFETQSPVMSELDQKISQIEEDFGGIGEGFDEFKQAITGFDINTQQSGDKDTHLSFPAFRTAIPAPTPPAEEISLANGHPP